MTNHPLMNYLEYSINKIQEEIDTVEVVCPDKIDFRSGQIKAYKDILNIFGNH